MAVIAVWIERIAGDEPIEYVVIGPHDDDKYTRGDDPKFNDAPIGKMLTWDEAKRFLSYEHNNGYGSNGCHPVFAWTATKIIAVMEYDGATRPAWFPRNPVDCVPDFSGFDGSD